ncbi:MAG: CarD family transcriptional regulator [Rhizobiales bacterium]|nr:CarD family transcriptional regulator [Hyphomicrobiales bacterium]
MKKDKKKMVKNKKAVAKKRPVAKARPAPKKVAKVKAKAKPAAKIKAKAKPAAKVVAKKPVVQAKPAHKPVVAHKPAIVAKPAPVKAATPVAKPVAAPVAHRPVAAAPVTKPMAAPQPQAIVVPPPPKKLSFKIGELVVYPAHGVGKITNIEEQEIAGARLELYIVDFEKEKLRLKVPTNRAEQKGMRRLAEKSLMEQALRVIRGRARIKRTMWSRRAQEYDAKINSGDLISVAEVVRDLYRSERQPEQSYSERQLFEQALMRMAREFAAIRRIDDDQAIKELEDFLAKNAKRGAAEKAEAEMPAEEAA